MLIKGGSGVTVFSIDNRVSVVIATIRQHIYYMPNIDSSTIIVIYSTRHARQLLLIWYIAYIAELTDPDLEIFWFKMWLNEYAWCNCCSVESHIPSDPSISSRI